jgi:hypothetical protein
VLLYIFTYVRDFLFIHTRVVNLHLYPSHPLFISIYYVQHEFNTSVTFNFRNRFCNVELVSNMLHLPSIMSFQQHTGVHYGRGSDAKGMHFYLTIELRELQDQELVSIN